MENLSFNTSHCVINSGYGGHRACRVPTAAQGSTRKNGTQQSRSHARCSRQPGRVARSLMRFKLGGFAPLLHLPFGRVGKSDSLLVRSERSNGISRLEGACRKTSIQSLLLLHPIAWLSAAPYTRLPQPPVSPREPRHSRAALGPSVFSRVDASGFRGHNPAFYWGQGGEVDKRQWASIDALWSLECGLSGHVPPLVAVSTLSADEPPARRSPPTSAVSSQSSSALRESERSQEPECEECVEGRRAVGCLINCPCFDSEYRDG